MRNRARQFSLARRLSFESLEHRLVLAADFGDAPQPYPTLIAENGARHEAVGPTLGVARDAETDGVHSPGANADGADEDGVVFEVLRVGQLNAVVTVSVTGAPSGAKLDAWIDFDQDGNWGGPAEKIFQSVPVSNGQNALTFDVPASTVDGIVLARFRLSTAGNLGVHGQAVDGEIEDLVLSIDAPESTAGVFTAAKVITSSALGVYDVHAADVDGDGDMDMLSASLDGSKFDWYENDGTQHFIARSIGANALRAIGVYAVDMDGDGDLDALTATREGGTIAWYENDGTPADGTWGYHPIQTNLGWLQNAYPVDLDGDGDMDAVAASSSRDMISWFENDGAQNFTTRAVGAVNNASFACAIDLDQDGDMDLLSSANGTLYWHENDGSENFSIHVLARNAFAHLQVAAADFDGDGDLDVVAAVVGNDQKWYENNGSQTFTVRTISRPGLGDVARSVFAADMDGDGDPDVVMQMRDGKIYWLVNDGTPANAPWIERTIESGSFFPSRVYVADIDRDGDLDVVAGSTGNDTVAWYENIENTVSITGPTDSVTEEGTTGLIYTLTRTQTTGAPLAVNFAVSGEAQFGVDYAVSGAAAFSPTSGTIFFPADVNQLQLVVAPIDDAALEPDERIILTLVPGADYIFGSTTVAVGFITSAESTLDFGDAPVPYPTRVFEGPARHVAVGPRLGSSRDTEADGIHSPQADADGTDEDGVTFGPLRVGQVQGSAVVNVQNAPSAAKLDVWIDFNRDGSWTSLGEHVVDSRTVTNGSNTVHFALPLNTRSGMTYARVRLSTGGHLGPGGLAADGEVEDFAISIAPPPFAPASFTSRITIAEAEKFTSTITAADVDGDGDLDAIANAGYVTWYENNGNPDVVAWTPHLITETNFNTTVSLLAADLDGDGDADVLAIQGGSLNWYENDGTPATGLWTLHPVIGAQLGSGAMRVFDMDADGDLDIVARWDDDMSRLGVRK